MSFLGFLMMLDLNEVHELEVILLLATEWTESKVN